MLWLFHLSSTLLLTPACLLSSITLSNHEVHALHMPTLRIRCAVFCTRLMLRRCSFTFVSHVLHAAQIVFCTHFSATFLTTRLRRTSPHHLPHANARALFVQRLATFGHRNTKLALGFGLLLPCSESLRLTFYFFVS